MFSSSTNAKMTCGLKVNTNDPGWYKSMTKVLKKIKGASYTIDVEEGMAYVTGRVNPTKLLRKLKSGNYANLCWVSAGNQITTYEGMQPQPGYWQNNHYDPMHNYYPPPRAAAMQAYPYHHDNYQPPYYGYWDRSMHRWV
ncbi:Metal ion binding protein [Melia azedarach]|uniref:Metal ion binding protein n=1 Tax=Melia azedarach TaxID=155640 RepID=A0ACC1YN40_MELAZ|nr:Metal ion binding protein [Melia azedarach]